MSIETRQIELSRMHAGQERVFRHPAKIKAALIARRWGKTEGGMIWIMEAAINGESCGWFSPTYKLLDDPWREICKTLAPIIKRKDAQMRRIELHTGGSIDYWSMDKDDAGRGRKYHKVFVDEAGWVRDFDEVFFEAIYPTLTDYDGDAVIAGTPKGRRGFYRTYERCLQGEDNMAAFTAKTIDNPYIDAKVIAQARLVMTPEQFAQEYEALPADDGGNPFGLEAIRRATEIMGEGPAVAYGADLAKVSDWTVIYGINENGQVCEAQRFQRDWNATRRQLAVTIGDTPALIDSTGVGSPIMEDIASVCPNASGFVFTQTSKQQLMEGLAAAFQTAEIRIPENRDLVLELESFGIEYTNGGRVRYYGPPGMHDDCVCALALAWKCYRDNNSGKVTGPMVSFGDRFGMGRGIQRRGIRTCL